MKNKIAPLLLESRESYRIQRAKRERGSGAESGKDSYSFFFLSIDNYNSPKNLFHKKVSCRRRDFYGYLVFLYK